MRCRIKVTACGYVYRYVAGSGVYRRRCATVIFDGNAAKSAYAACLRDGYTALIRTVVSAGCRDTVTQRRIGRGGRINRYVYPVYYVVIVGRV